MNKWIYSSICMLVCGLGFSQAVHADTINEHATVNESEYQWSRAETSLITISDFIKSPSGYKQILQDIDSFGSWLRKLPILQNSETVMLFNGKEKFNQLAHHSIIDIDVGNRDLQQCADAAMRLRAEYLFAKGKFEQIHFNFTSGDKASWLEWASGKRPVVKGNKVSWKQTGVEDHSYNNFRKYLNIVFTYAGSASLALELEKVRDPQKILPGDVFIQGGFPGHAVVVMDVAENTDGKRIFILAQSYMPAQQIYILNNPKFWNGPWYHAESSGKLITPEWIFNFSDLMRFNKN